MHGVGINARYLLQLAEQVRFLFEARLMGVSFPQAKPPATKRLLRTEAVARVLKV
jgi:hypothetical protein